MSIMRSLSDVNLLLALALRTHKDHARASAWLDQREDASVAVCRLTQNGLLRLMTQEKVMGPFVCTMKRAWQVHDEMLSDSRFVFVEEPEGLDQIWRALSSQSIIAPHLWTDAYLAAFAAAARMQLVTFDRGFRHFPGVSVLILAEPSVHEEKLQYHAAQE
jgi:uncharacterized protein